MVKDDLSCYKEMYLYLFTQVSAALGELRWGYATFAIERLKQAQLRCEELFMESADEE